ncbi:hypothetical protein ACH427_31255 [Streptomyces sp. NPDC020379]|uniref:hypothetical protein n=1 Tax=Streptomyces sp. NPDC020379 TaxID=3365071 RepID=UPI0037A06B39
MATSTGMARAPRDMPARSGLALIGGEPVECARVPGVDGVAVSLATDGALSELVWSSPGAGERFENEQYTRGEASGAAAPGSRAVIVEPDLGRGRSDRWPAPLPALAGPGVDALFCFPPRIGGACLGVLTAQRAR